MTNRRDIEVKEAHKIAEHIHNLGEVLDVAGLISKLAGLPPMMPVYAHADGTTLFVNDLTVHQLADDSPPFLIIQCSEVLQVRRPPALSKEEQVAKKRQEAMQLSHNQEQAVKMPEIVE